MDTIRVIPSACMDALQQLVAAPKGAIAAPAQAFVKCIEACTPKHSSR